MTTGLAFPSPPPSRPARRTPILLLAAVLTLPLVGAVGHAAPGLQATAEAALADRFPAEAERLRVRVLRTGGTVDETAPLRIALPSEAALPRGHTQVDVLARNATGWQKTGWALLYVAHFDSVVVARRAVRRDDVVLPADLGTAWMETTKFHGEPLRASDLDALDGDLFAARSLREGRALRRDDLRLPYAAETGDAVTMHYRRGPLVMELPCHAREAGFVGDEIRLHSPTTGATYRARLTDSGVAEWTATL